MNEVLLWVAYGAIPAVLIGIVVFVALLTAAPSQIHRKQNEEIESLRNALRDDLQIVFSRTPAHLMESEINSIFRVGIRNNSADQVIKNASAYLTKIEYVGIRGKRAAERQAAPFRGRVRLSTQHGHGKPNPPQTFNLSPGAEEPVDVIKRAYKRSDYIFLCHELGAWLPMSELPEVQARQNIRGELVRSHDDRLKFGTYKVEVTAYAEGCRPAIACFLVEASKRKGSRIKVTQLENWDAPPTER